MKKKIVKLTEQDLENLVRKVIKEEGEEYRSNDPRQLDLFSGKSNIDSAKIQEFQEIKNAIIDEIESLNEDNLYQAAFDGGIENELMGFFDVVQELESWINDNDTDEDLYELTDEAKDLLDSLEGTYPFDISITLDPEFIESIKNL
jgi:hypothetical protein